MTNSTFGILFVCTGNICRSPVAEVATRRLLDARCGADAVAFTVASAGTAAIDGTPMASDTHTALSAALGDDRAARSFRARRLDVGMVASADLVLTAERRHRTLVVTHQPAAVAKTFCLREFVRLLSDCSADEWNDLPADLVSHARSVVTLARQRRGLAGYVRAEDDNIPDPITHMRGAHRWSVELIAAISKQVVALLTPAAPHTGTDLRQEGATA